MVRRVAGRETVSMTELIDIADSGIPKVDAPDFRLIDERKLPRMTGDPGFTSWVKVQRLSYDFSWLREI
jgi:hypothetical protein